MAALLHQEGVRDLLHQEGKRQAGSAGQLRTFTSQGRSSKLLRSTTEGVGMYRGGEFNVVEAAYRLFDPQGKGHITADDLYRVCNQVCHTGPPSLRHTHPNPNPDPDP